MRSNQTAWFPVIAFSIALFSAGAAEADLYRCQRADGSIVYTDSRATCPGAEQHHSSGSLQSISNPSTPSKPARRARSAPSRINDTAAAEAAWRSKKEQSSHELSVVTERHDSLVRYVSHCNRGGELFRTLDNGLKEGVSCDQVVSEVAALASRRDELRHYLDRGIYEACRKAGCLPGWIR